MLCRVPPALAAVSGAALAAALVAVLAGGCAQPSGLHVQGDAMSPSAEVGPVYVADTRGKPMRQPTAIALSGQVELAELRWADWGGATAVATGKLSGDWCRPECGDEPYEVTVTLSGLERQERIAYYRRATVEPERPEDLPKVAVTVQLQRIRLVEPGF
ncbi:hypothetical protein U9R90_31375 [Streptomyces sp. E11-3]|uniref:hypothetical protein n=1 Tax=Streptomyces sp. E11-3 TaxID=3110112 RepID=UPI0039808558